MPKSEAKEQWPHDHAAKHARAARLGWARRAKAFGGNPAHTVKSGHLKERKKPEKKQAAPKAPAHGGSPQIIASRGARGWYATLLFPDGYRQQTTFVPTREKAMKAAERMQRGGGMEVDKPRLLTEADVIKNKEHAGYLGRSMFEDVGYNERKASKYGR